jgi:N-acetylmuramoyl-L-alanine amidase
VVVVDPAHGGADAGARGSSGVLESEVVLSFARVMRTELERQGLRVLLTRQGNENPSFDERSAVANGQRGALFISLHVSSTGLVGTARAYSFMAPPRQQTRSAAANPAAHTSLVHWDQAQESYADGSRRLAELVQVQLAQKFRGSPEVPTGAAVRQLRTVAAPAIAIEVSSVSVRDRKQLEQMAPGLAEAVSRAVAAFRLVYEKGAK